MLVEFFRESRWLSSILQTEIVSFIRMDTFQTFMPTTQCENFPTKGEPKIFQAL